MSSYFSGQNGALLIDGVQAARVQNWSFNSSATLLDTTNLGDTDTTSIYGVRTTTGQCRIYYYQNQPGENGDASALLRKLLKARTTGNVAGIAAEPENVTLRLLIEDGTTNGKYVEFSTLITSASMAMAVGDVLAADISFQANGAPTALTL